MGFLDALRKFFEPGPSDAEIAEKFHAQSKATGDSAMEVIVPMLTSGEVHHEGCGDFTLKGVWETYRVRGEFDFDFEEMCLYFDVDVQGEFEVEDDGSTGGPDSGLYNSLPEELRTRVELALDHGDAELRLRNGSIYLHDYEFDTIEDEIAALLALLRDVASALEKPR